MTRLAAAILALTVGCVVLCPARADESNPVSVSKTFIVTSNQKSVTWTTCLDFTNQTNRIIQAIKFQFIYKDAFDEEAATFHGDRVGDFAPGVLIEGPNDASDYLTTGNDRKAQNCFSYPTVVGSVSAVDVEVLKVRYGDGTIWTNPNPAPIFTGQFMLNIGDNYPKRIGCGILSFTWDQAQTIPGCRKAIKAWYESHQATPLPSPSPSAEASPGATPTP